MCEAEMVYKKLEAERPRVLNKEALALLNDLANDKEKASRSLSAQAPTTKTAS